MGAAAHETVVDLLAEEWAAIAELGVGLGDQEWDLPSECPGWTVRDVLSHMVGTERSLLGDPPPPRDGPLPTYVRNPVGATNEAWVDARRRLPGPEVLGEFRNVTAARLQQLREAAAERFDEIGPSPVGEVPYRVFMQVRLMDCWVHEQDMRVATGRPGHGLGPVAELSMDRLVSAMPFVVGKQAKAPDGKTVRFDLLGPSERRFDVAVRDGRAAFVAAAEEDPPGPDAVLTMDAEVFWRLACGRVTGQAAVAAELVAVGGDAGLGQRVLDAMAFMI